MAEQLTLMAVHAHPDDESSSTGGVLAKYSAEGIRTVVVTCTNGEFGDAPGQVKPGQDGHDEESVAKIRLAELRTACDLLRVSDLEVLGYHDSGMEEWDYKDRPDVFSNVPLATVRDRIAGLIDRYRPQVVVTYDDNGGYQHPDHLHAARAAVAAVSATGIPSKLYLTAMRSARSVSYTHLDVYKRQAQGPAAPGHADGPGAVVRGGRGDPGRPAGGLLGAAHSRREGQSRRGRPGRADGIP